MRLFYHSHEDLRLPGRSPKLLETLGKRMELYRAEGKVNSFYRVRSARNAVTEFCRGKDCRFSDITPEWLSACDRYWRAGGKSSTTILIYMKVLKCEMNELVRSGQMKAESFPFGKGRYEAPHPSSRKLALDIEQVRLIASYSGNTTIERYRDLWLFSYLCNGINFRDMLFLRYSNIKNGEIVFVRSKTAHSLAQIKEIRAAFMPQMKEIVNRWGNVYDGNPDTFLFKYAKGDESPFEADALVRKVTALCNRHLKRLAEILELPPFTTYSARHSFATILNRQGVDLKYISDSLGHSSLQMTETYLAGFSKEDRKKYSELLL